MHRASEHNGKQCLLIFVFFFAITSNEDTRRTLGLVKEVAVDGEEGPAHDAASGRSDARHLWIAKENALTWTCPAVSHLACRDKTSPANV